MRITFIARKCGRSEVTILLGIFRAKVKIILTRKSPTSTQQIGLFKFPNLPPKIIFTFRKNLFADLNPLNLGASYLLRKTKNSLTSFNYSKRNFN